MREPDPIRLRGLRYRVAYVAKLWRPGERPHLASHVLEGAAGLSIWLEVTQIALGRMFELPLGRWRNVRTHAEIIVGLAFEPRQT